MRRILKLKLKELTHILIYMDRETLVKEVIL